MSIEHYREEFTLGLDLLSETVSIERGNVPILLTVPHDGSNRRIGNTELTVCQIKPRDFAVNAITRELMCHMEQLTGKHPTYLKQNILRQHMSPQIQQHLEDQTIVEIDRLLREFSPVPVFHFDLHGFSEQFLLGDYDFVLGTDHRKSLLDSNIDLHFGGFMGERGYNVYIPSCNSVEGERYGATEERLSDQNTLVQVVKQRLQKAGGMTVISMQIEIARHFREKNNLEFGRKLSRDLAEFLVQIPKV